MKRTIFFVAWLAVASATAATCVAQANGPVNFRPGSDLQKRNASPTPGPGSTKQSKQAAIGHGQVAIVTGDPQDLFWNEPVDLEGAGSVVNADMLWDGSSKILYAFAHTSLRCTHGKSIEGDILLGIYGKKNFLGKTPGSGWWMVELAQNQCEAPTAGLYGCKFGAQGNTLACGHAEIDPRINDMVIVESTRF